LTRWLHDGLEFRYREAPPREEEAPLAEGELVFFFQHGLGGDVNQPLGLFRPSPGVRAISLDCRGHGLTSPLGPEEKLSISQFADDLTALMDHLGVQRAVVGGISMGAAVALNLTLRRPERVRGLVLARAAWLDGPMDKNADLFAHVARLIRTHGADRGAELFEHTADYREMLAASPDCAMALLGQFLSPRAEETVAKLERIPRDQPCGSLDEVTRIAVPTLVLANRIDPIHPYEYGVELARRIPGAEFRELTPKSTSVPQYEADMQRELTAFLERHFLSPSPSPSGRGPG
jgi:pimeloyl-ACP methyl ester carboxylesterase